VGGNQLPSIDRIFKRRTYSEELGETAILGPRLVNDIRLQFQLGSPITQFAPVIYGTQFEVPISTGGTFTSGASQSALLLNRQYEANDTVSITEGRQQIRLGADVIAAHNGGNSKEYGGPIYDGRFLYKTCTQPLSSCESPAYLNNLANVQSYTQSYGKANYAVSDVLWALFMQDDYRVRRDFTLNLGLRYERQTFTDSDRNFAPRLGFAYDWRGEGKTVLGGGFGIYYSQIADNSAANYALTGPEGVFNYTATPGQIGFPVSIAAAPQRAFPRGAAAQPLHTVGRQRLSGPNFPHRHARQISQCAAKSLFRAVDLRRRAAACKAMGPDGVLRRLTHTAHKSAAGCRFGGVYTHGSGPGSIGTSGKLHAPLWGLVVCAANNDVQPDRGYEPAAAL
jgi:hypothetical protein